MELQDFSFYPAGIVKLARIFGDYFSLFLLALVAMESGPFDFQNFVVNGIIYRQSTKLDNFLNFCLNSSDCYEH